jgi:uncharacterized protein
MLYRELGVTGVKLSILGFGCMRLPVKNGDNGQVDMDLAVPLIRTAIDNGINYLDTGYPYHGGQSELAVSKAIKDGYRDKVFIADKLPIWMVENRKDMDHYLDEQLSRLDIDCIDFYLLHTVKENYWENLISNGVLEFLDDAIADGKIKHTGFSYHGELELFFDVIDSYNWDMCQVQYNIVDQNYQAGREGIRYAAANDVGVVVMEPLRGGSLTRNVPEEVQEIWDESTLKRDPAEWALRFVWDLDDVDVVLSGMNTIEELKQNIKTANHGYSNSLNSEDKEIIREVKSVYNQRKQYNCTQCGYCIPCPEGVDIPANLLYLNNAYMFQDNDNAKMNYYMAVKEENRAFNCTECGECEKICPQMVPIQLAMKEVCKKFDQNQ